MVVPKFGYFLASPISLRLKNEHEKAKNIFTQLSYIQDINSEWASAIWASTLTHCNNKAFIVYSFKI